MLRLAFLFLVVLGALAIVLGLVMGVGIWHAGRLRATEQAAIAPASPASQPAAKPATSPAVASANPANGQTIPAGAANAANPAPKTIILPIKEAVIHGDDLRVAGDGDAKAIVNWTNRDDFLEWVVTIPHRGGAYEIAFEYSAAPGEFGGVAELMFGTWPRGYLTVSPTKGWNDFQTTTVRTMLLPEGKTSVVLHPVMIVWDKQLMNLKSIRLTLIKEMDVPTFPDRRGGFRRRGLLQ